MRNTLLKGTKMKTNTDLALIPVNYEIQPVQSASNRGIDRYVTERDKLVRITSSGSKLRRIGITYSNIGQEKDKKGIGENIDLYV